MAAWVWVRRSMPALITSIVIGGLYAIEQVAYLGVEIGDSSWVRALGDLFGLAAGVAIVLGAIRALMARRAIEPTAAG